MKQRLYDLARLLVALAVLIVSGAAATVGAQTGKYPVITPENAAQLAQVAGRPPATPPGTVWRIGWGLDERTVVIHDAAGVWLLDAAGEAETRFLAVPSQVSAISTGTMMLAAGKLDGTLARWFIMPSGAGIDTAGDPLDVPDEDAHTGPLRTMVFSPDGFLLATGGMDGTVRVRDAFGGDAPLVLQAQVTGLAFSPDGALLAGGLFSKAVQLWDASTGEAVRTMGDGTDTVSVSGVVFSPDGRLVAAGAADGTVTLWDAASGETARVFEHPALVMAVAFSPDGQLLAAGYDDGSIHVWETAGGEHLVTLEGHLASVSSLVFSPAGTILSSGGYDGAALFWGVPEAQPVFATPVSQANPDVPASVIDGSAAPITPANAGQVAQAVELSFDNGVNDVAFYPDGSVLAAAVDHSQPGVVWLWDAVAGTPLGSLPGDENDPALQVAFSPDGAWLAIGSLGSVKLWDMATMQNRVFSAPGEFSMVMDMAFSPDGSLLAGGNIIGQVWLWTVASGEHVALPHTFEMGVNSLGFNPGGSLLAVGSGEGLYVWDMAAMQPVVTPRIEANPGVYGVAFSPDGARLAIGDGLNLEIWDVATWQPLMSLEGHQAVISRVAFSPGGAVIATASSDNTVRLWDAASGAALAVLDGHMQKVSQVIFSPGGAALASASADGTVRLWMVGAQ